MSDFLEGILIEKEHIEKTLDVIQEARRRAEPSYVELSAIGASLHHCYSGMENILKRLLKAQNISIPDSASSHKYLLNTAVSKGIITESMLDRLDKFRGFRHFFVHAYGILLNEEELMPLAEDIPDAWQQFLSEIEIHLMNDQPPSK